MARAMMGRTRPIRAKPGKAATEDESQEDATIFTRNVLVEGAPHEGHEGHEGQAATARSDQLRSARGDFVLSPCLS